MSERRPLLSVIIPVYKTEEYLKRCVDSVRAQTYQELEIILVDDGSPDRCGQMCDAFAAEDPRIRVIHKQNGGQSSARNAALDIATGELVGFVDSDDYILPDMYERLFRLMNEYQADIACCNCEGRGASGHIDYSCDDLDEISVFSRKESLAVLLTNSRVIYGVWNKLYRRGGFWTDYRFLPMIYEDADASAQCLSHADKVVYTGAPLYIYWQNEGSTTRQAFSMKQFDDLKSRTLLMPIYEQHCPERLEDVRASYVTTGIRILKSSVGCRDTQDIGPRRRELYDTLRAYIREHPHLPYPVKERIKLSLLKLGLPVFDLVMGAYARLKG